MVALTWGRSRPAAGVVLLCWCSSLFLALATTAPRFCILDNPSKTPELFNQHIQDLKLEFKHNGTGLWTFLAYGRDKGSFCRTIYGLSLLLLL